MSGLPEIIPIFPLPNVVLFPDVELPLHIFEPRYRQMVTDIAEDHRLIGMVLLKGDWEHDYYGHPDLFEIGCAGKITRLVQLPDGRFNLILNGLSEFRIERELRDRSYRQADVRWCPTDAEALSFDLVAMEKLRQLLFTYVGKPAQEAWHSLVEERGLRGAELINFLCFHLDLNPIEKQTLLEARDERVACLLDVLTFRIEERKLGPGGAKGGSDLVQ